MTSSFDQAYWPKASYPFGLFIKADILKRDFQSEAGIGAGDEDGLAREAGSRSDDPGPSLRKERNRVGVHGAMR